MAELVFFYGTLMTPFNRPGRRRIDDHLTFRGRGSIAAALFDLGIYPAAVPAADTRVRGEVYEMTQPLVVLHVLDDTEGYRPGEPETSLYTRLLTPFSSMTGERLTRGSISITRRSAARSASRRATIWNTSRQASSARLERVEELRDHRLNAIGQVDKLDPRPIGDDVLIDIRDVRVGDPALEYHGLRTEREAQVVKRVEVEGKTCLDRCAGAAHLLDVQRLEHHDFALKITEDEYTVFVTIVGIGFHPRGI